VVSGTLPLQFIAGSDPAAVNTALNPSTVSVQSSTSANPVTVPAYSVVRVDLDSPRCRRWSTAQVMLRVRWRRRKLCRCSDRGWLRRRPSRSLPLPTVLGGTSVYINGQPAFLFAVTPGQANVLVPAGLAAGPATVTVLHGATVALTASMTIASSAPGLYSANADGAGAAAANAYLVTASNQKVNQAAYTCNPPAARSCLAAPLSLGGSTDTLYIELYGTGIRGAASVQCFVAGQSVPVSTPGRWRRTPGWTR
jgi:uncharacterized protein (TIGR03437 family)